MVTEQHFKYIRNLIYGDTSSVKQGLHFLTAFSKQKSFDNIRASVHKNYVRLYWKPEEDCLCFPIRSKGKNVNLFPMVLLKLLDLGIVNGSEIHVLKLIFPTSSTLSKILSQTPNLTELQCEFIDGQTFPKCIVGLTKLTCIRTNLSFVHKKILDMPSLEKIHLPMRNKNLLQNHPRYIKLIQNDINSSQNFYRYSYKSFYRLKSSKKDKGNYVGGRNQKEYTIDQRLQQLHQKK